MSAIPVAIRITAPHPRPWQTLAQVSSKLFNPGDSILLNGGQNFTGPLTMNSSGSSGNPITIGSYGTGNAIINAGAGDGIYSTNTSYVTVENLTIYGSASSSGGGAGVNFNAASGSQSNITINNVTAYGTTGVTNDGGYQNGGYGFDTGIKVQANGGEYESVLVENSTAYNCATYGVLIAGNGNNFSPSSNFSAVPLNNNVTYDSGNYNPTHGAGVFLYGVNGGVVEYSTAYNNGDLGMWTWSTNNITFTHDTVYGTHGEGGDGAFDLDGNVTNSTIGYSYSYNNKQGGIPATQVLGQ